MKHFDLKQQELADLLGVPLARIKRLSGGKVRNLTRDESEALVTKLRIRPEWLITGEGPMLDDDESDEAFERRQRAVMWGTALAQALPLSELEAAQLAALINGDPAHDGPAIAAALARSYGKATLAACGVSEEVSAGVVFSGVPLADAEAIAQLVHPAPEMARVTQLHADPPSYLTRQQVLEIVLDAMFTARRSLPAKAVNALVDTAMQLQRAGVPVSQAAFAAQLGAVK
ncbi:MAG: helix-turn-helix domain-containing protein [Rhodocyclales bacterium]|nr:helix-turn-helix domain-containing protein [Rhodocyclales bacterium]